MCAFVAEMPVPGTRLILVWILYRVPGGRNGENSNLSFWRAQEFKTLHHPSTLIITCMHGTGARSSYIFVAKFSEVEVHTIDLLVRVHIEPCACVVEVHEGT